MNRSRLGWTAAVLLLVVIGGGFGFWVASRLVLGLKLSEQPGNVRFPDTSYVSAMARNKVRIKLDGLIDAQVPFKQTLQLPLHGHYDTTIAFDTVVPITFTIVYRGAIPVDTMADIEGVTDFNYENVKRLRNVPFKARLPLKFVQPIALTVPVHANLHLVYRGPLGIEFNQVVNAPVDTTLSTRLLARREIETPILARFGLNVRWPHEAVPVVITDADLKLNLDTLRLRTASADEETATDRAH